MFLQRRRCARQERLSDITVDEQAFGGIADARPLAFCIHQDALGHVEVRVAINIDVAIPAVMLERRHRRFLSYPANQALTAARDHQIDVRIHFQKMADRGAVGGRDELHGIRREVHGSQRAL